MQRYGVRVGDDGKFILKTDDAVEARRAACRFSKTNGLRQAYVRDFDEDRNVALYRDGLVIWNREVIR